MRWPNLWQALNLGGSKARAHQLSRAGQASNTKVESLANRLAALEAGRQPGYGKKFPLIDKGLHDPEKHLREAVRLKHPFNTNDTLKQDHKRVLDIFKATAMENNTRRLRALADLRILAKAKELADRNEVMRKKTQQYRSCV